LILHLFHFTTI